MTKKEQIKKVDEDNLKEAIIKKESKPSDKAKIDILIQQSLIEYHKLYKELVAN